jgi:hypothetical protein
MEHKRSDANKKVTKIGDSKHVGMAMSAARGYSDGGKVEEEQVR